MQKQNYTENSVSQVKHLNSWAFLTKYLTADEYFVAVMFSEMIQPNTNSLEPLNDRTTGMKLQEIFGVSRLSLKIHVKKLFELGAYGNFSSASLKKNNKFWIFNPYLSSIGEVEPITFELFNDTHVHKAFFDPNYELTPQEIIDLKIRPSTAKRRKAKK